MRSFNFQEAVAKKQDNENRLANKLGNASDETIKNFVDKKSNFAQFLMTIRDQIVKTGDQQTWTALIRIQEKVKAKLLITQDEVDLLQAYGLKDRKNMNVTGRTFSSLEHCDFTNAEIKYIQVNGRIFHCTFSHIFNIVVSGDIVLNTVAGRIADNKVSGSISHNNISGDMIYNTVAGIINNNTISGNITDSGNITENTSGSIIDNEVSGNITYNIVKDNISRNIATDIFGNKYLEATDNKYTNKSDLSDPSNTKMNSEELEAYHQKFSS